MVAFPPRSGRNLTTGNFYFFLNFSQPKARAVECGLSQFRRRRGPRGARVPRFRRIVQVGLTVRSVSGIRTEIRSVSGIQIDIRSVSGIRTVVLGVYDIFFLSNSSQQSRAQRSVGSAYTIRNALKLENRPEYLQEWHMRNPKISFVDGETIGDIGNNVTYAEKPTGCGCQEMIGR